MDSYRVEKLAMQKIILSDEDAEIPPVPVETGGHKPEPEIDYLSNILKSFNELFGNVPWEDKDRVLQRINDHITTSVAADKAYTNARKQLDPTNARIESDKALNRVMIAGMKDDSELFKLFSDNESFRKWLSDLVFERTYNHPIE
jgi:type I restriction enzyme R subunit